jgi:hypothetical protein
MRPTYYERKTDTYKPEMDILRAECAAGGMNGIHHFNEYARLPTMNIVLQACAMLKDVGIYHMFSQFLNFEHGGKVVFDVSPPMAKALLATRVNIPLNEIPWPFKSFYVKLNDCGLTVANNITGEHELEGIHVTVTDGIVDIFVVGLPNENSAKYIEETSGGRGNPDDDDAIVFFNMDNDSRKLENALDHLERVVTTDDEEGEMGVMLRTPDGYKRVAASTPEQRAMFRAHDYFVLVANLALYVTSEQADVEIREGRERVSGRVKSAMTRRLVGYRSKLRMDKTASNGDSPDTGRTIGVRHIVSGHWTTKNVGQGGVDRVRRWIEPYWRGPQVGDVIGRTIEVE